jgi:predicted nucleic acid-binding Zn ribbon protein
VDRASNVVRQTRKVAARPDRSCLFCGAILPREKDGKAAYCSVVCQRKYYSRAKAAANKAARRAAMGPCRQCGATIPDSRTANARYCSTKCRNQSQIPTIVASNRKRLYGITQPEFDARLVAQGGRCAICGSAEPGGKGGFALDHDHATDRVRGLLCTNCNMGLGRFRDDPALLRAAADYLS